MPQKTGYITKDMLKNLTYGPAHLIDINKVQKMLVDEGYEIDDTIIKANSMSDSVNTVFRLVTRGEATRIFSVSTSTTKRWNTHFSAGVSFLGGDLFKTTDGTMKDVIKTIDDVYDVAQVFKERLELVQLPARLKAQIAGDLFFNYDIFSVTQISIVKTKIKDHKNAWEFYIHLSRVLKESHPKDYIPSGRTLFDYFSREIVPMETTKRNKIKPEYGVTFL